MLVLGHKGMLGQMVMKYFGSKGYSLQTVSARFNAEERSRFLKEILQHPQAVIVNCIGKIKQKTEDDNELLWANALLPMALNMHLLPTQTLVHPSTDCVFDGTAGIPYSIADQPDAIDTYGWSKALGEKALKERLNTIIFRVSIIGPDENPEGKGLLSWFLSNKEGAELKGYSNHYWNGITTLEWCKQVEQLLQTKNVEKKVIFEVGGTEESYSKFEMLQLFQKKYKTNYRVEPFFTSEAMDRRMEPSRKSNALEEQLDELLHLGGQ